jgi:hypothetical protein
MPTTPPTDPATEARDVLELARWYRNWADLARDDHERDRRLEMATVLELRARKLARPD